MCMNEVGESRQHVAALRERVEAGDVRGVARVVRESWFDLLTEHGEVTRVLLERVPPADLRSEPLLLMMLGICYNAAGFHRLRGLRYFQWAVRAAGADRNDLELIDRAFIRASAGVAYRLVGRPRRSIAASKEAVELLDRVVESELEVPNQLTRVYGQVGVSLFYAGDVPAAIDALTKGLAITPTQPPSPGFGNLAMLAGIHALRGDLPEARSHVDYARTGPWTDRQRDMYPGTFYRLAETMLALERFDTASAREQLAAMRHDRRSIEHWVAIAQVETMTGMVEGQPGRALAQLETLVTMRAREARHGSASGALNRMRALLQLGLGRPETAKALVGRTSGDNPQVRIDRARVELAMGHTGSAMANLESIAAAVLPARSVAEATALEAAVLLRLHPQGRTDGVLNHLGAVLRETQLRLPLALLPPADFARVTAALTVAGFDDVVSATPLRSLLPELNGRPELTTRERAVLAQLMTTGSASEIAAALFVSPNTVKTHTKSLYRKLGVTNREDAVAVAHGGSLLEEHN